jgi:hypothetical protein
LVEEAAMAGERPSGPHSDAPRTDLPPRREPYTDDGFGTGEEEGVVREREAAERPEDEEGTARSRTVAEDCAGGDREI